jgi:glutamine amidotransferase
MIVIIDYGLGNIGSIVNMFKKIGVKAESTSTKDGIEAAEKLVLPGVGAFDNGMENLEKLGLIPVLNKKVLEEKTPVIGICLGFQLLSKSSDEGKRSGLGWINANTRKFDFPKGSALKIPHMGWNNVNLKKQSKLFNDMYDEPRYYFVHSYHVCCNDNNDILTTTRYGYVFVSSIQRDNIYGCQFHPEKSHKYGLKLLSNFAEI